LKDLEADLGVVALAMAQQQAVHPVVAAHGGILVEDVQEDSPGPLARNQQHRAESPVAAALEEKQQLGDEKNPQQEACLVAR